MQRLRAGRLTFKREHNLNHLLKENDAVLFIDRKGRRYLKICGAERSSRFAAISRRRASTGSRKARASNSAPARNISCCGPTYADLIPHLPRAAQVIYPKDTGPLLIWGDVYPGATVIEGGVGAGAFTIALLRAVGPTGRVISYELREDFAARAKRNVATFFGEAPNWTIKLRDLYEGFDETGVDRLFIDLPEPGRALDVVARALRPGGVFVGYVPTALQLKDTVEALQRRPDFAEIESFETLMRNWHVKGMSVRPVHRMIAHSALYHRRAPVVGYVRRNPGSLRLRGRRGAKPAEVSESAIDQPDDVGDDMIDDDDSDGDLSETLNQPCEMH